MRALEMGPIQVFGTAYDPSDLPGTSVDPLGFDGGYVALAEALLPGFTTITDGPRYPGMLCAGLYHLGQHSTDGPTGSVAKEDERLQGLLRFERLWAVASALRWLEHPEEREDGFGTLRGVTYAMRQAERVKERGLSSVPPDFPFLRSQRITGGVGTYRSLLEKCGLLYPGEWRLTTGLGEDLGGAFLRDTRTPTAVRRSVVESTEVPVAALTAWGQHAHPLRRLLDEEKTVLHEAVMSSGQRRAALGLLRSVGTGWLRAGGGQLFAIEQMLGLAREGRTVRGVPPEIYPALKATLTVIPAYEAAYRVAQLGFERVLWLVRESPGGVAKDAVLRDETVKRLPRLLHEVAQGLSGALAENSGDLPQSVRDAIGNAAAFVEDLGRRSGDKEETVGAVLRRHREVQEGKLDRGRRKAPWVVEDSGAFRLTFARAGGLDQPVTGPEEIAAHDYRLRNARRFLVALEIVA